MLLAGCGPAQTSIQAIDALQAQGKSDQALQRANNALKQAQAGSPVYWDLALRKAQILEKLARPEDALAWLQSVPPKGRAAPAQATLLIREQAAIESDLGHFRDSDSHLLEALALARESGQRRMTATLEVRRAKVLIKLDRQQEAAQSLSDAEQYGREKHDRTLEPYIQHYRGLISLSTNQFEDAIPPLERSLQGFRRAQQPALAANVIISLAWCYYRLGRFDKALALYQEALGMAAPEDRHLCLGHLGNMFFEERQYAKAASYYQQAAGLAKGRKQYYYFQWLTNLATALIEQGKWNEAERFNNEALRVDTSLEGSLGRRQALVNEGRIETSQKNYTAAESVLRQCANSREGDQSATLDAYSALAQLYVQMRRPDAARQQFEAALSAADQNRATLKEDEDKLAYVASLINLHREYVDFLMDRGETAAAFQAAESSRARLLRERMNVPGAEREAHSIGEYEAAARAGDTIFLAYWIGPQKSYLWEITGTSFASFPLPAGPEISSLVDKYQTALEKQSQRRRTSGEELFDLLLGRNKGVLKRGSRYVIVPDGPLYGLNFETLPLPGSPAHFWIEDATVSIAPSLGLLLARHAEARPSRSLLLVGDATEWNEQFPKLIYARREIEGIEHGFPAARQKVLLGAAATPAGYEQANPAQYSYIHFAAHATANRNSPLDSSIVLSQDGSSGKLSVKQILGSRVHAALVTISACHSAGARTYGGEGLVGFAWAFLQSGARGVVAGLWDVSDYSSPPLMEALYAGLSASKPPADALRAAKLHLIAGGKYADPYYWGAFQLYVGELYRRAPSKPPVLRTSRACGGAGLSVVASGGRLTRRCEWLNPDYRRNPLRSDIRRLPNSPKRALARDLIKRNCVLVSFISRQIRSADCSCR